MGYQALGGALKYGAWNTLEIDLTGNAFTACVNASHQDAETAGPGTGRLTAMFVDTTNAGDVSSRDNGGSRRNGATLSR